MIRTPASILHDVNGIPTAVSASAQPTSGALGHVMAGFDAANAVRYASFDADALRVTGTLAINDSGGSITVDGFVTAFGSNDVALQQDVTNRLIVVDADVSGAIDDTRLTLSSSIQEFKDANRADLLAVSGTITSAESVLSGALAQIYTELDSGNVDIRALTFSTDSVTAFQGGIFSVTGSGDVGVLRQNGITGELIITGSTIITRGNDGSSDRTLRTDDTGRLQVGISSGSAGTVSVLSGSQLASSQDRSLVVYMSPNQQPIPTALIPETSNPGFTVGRRSDIGANTFVPVRQTTYNEQTTAAQRSIISTSAADSSAGTGARTVDIIYYDSSVNGPFVETVTLNGTTAVNTVNTNICFIESIIVRTIGSNGSNVGNLNLYTGLNATGTIFAAVGLGAVATGVGDNRTFYAHHYVAPGRSFTGYTVTAGYFIAGTGRTTVTVVRARNPTVPTSPFQVISEFIVTPGGASTIRPYAVNIKLSGPAVVVAFVTPTQNASTAICSFDWSEAD